jgi:hypothetical protein
MASTFSTDLKIELIANGEQSGTWGTTTNDNFTNVFEDAIVGTGNPVFTTDANLTLTYTSTNTSQIARNLFLSVTSTVVGGLTATRSLIVPTIYKNYLVKNSTTGGQSILVKTAAGTGITIPNGYTAFVYVDGTNVVQAFDYVPSISSINAVIAGGSVNFTPIGASSPSTGAFTQITAPIYNGNAAFNSTGAITVPVGTTAQRPTPSTGMFRFNSNGSAFEGYNGTAWASVGGASGGAGNPFVYENDQVITTNYTITAGKNGMSTGTLTINSGVTVTVPSGSRWVVL